jgi:hypothetical protein
MTPTLTAQNLVAKWLFIVPMKKLSIIRTPVLMLLLLLLPVVASAQTVGFKGLNLRMSRAEVNRLLSTTEWEIHDNPDGVITRLDNLVDWVDLSIDNTPAVDVVMVVFTLDSARNMTVRSMAVRGKTSTVKGVRQNTEQLMETATALYGQPDSIHRTIASLSNDLLSRLGKKNSLILAIWYSPNKEFSITLRLRKDKEGAFTPEMILSNTEE